MRRYGLRWENMALTRTAEAVEEEDEEEDVDPGSEALAPREDEEEDALSLPAVPFFLLVLFSPLPALFPVLPPFPPPSAFCAALAARCASCLARRSALESFGLAFFLPALGLA